jgi:hypothetical protein
VQLENPVGDQKRFVYRPGLKVFLRLSARVLEETDMPDVIRTKLSGHDLLNNPRLNKGTAFTEEERDAFALHGLLPPHPGTLEDQLERRMKALGNQQSAFDKYRFLRDLQDTNETLFYSMISHNVEELLQQFLHLPWSCSRHSHFQGETRNGQDDHGIGQGARSIVPDVEGWECGSVASNC